MNEERINNPTEHPQQRIKVLELPEVRISSASLTRICDDQGKFALLINKNRASKGEIILTPIGGGIEATDEGIKDLKKILGIDDSTLEKGNDLRFRIPGEKANKYREWFLYRQNRETDSLREVREELVDEENLLDEDDLRELECNLSGYSTELEETTKTGQEGKLTLRLLEVFEAKIRTEVIGKLTNLSNQPNATIYFVTAEEIRNGQTTSGIKIGSVSKALLQPKETIEEFV